MAKNELNFTKIAIEKIVPPATDRDYYHDLKQKGLILDVTKAGSKSFYLYAKINGRPERIRLGSFPDMTVEQARKAAVDARAQIHSGRNPNIEKKKLKDTVSFEELVEMYIDRYAKKQKKTWKEDRRRIYKFTSIWFERKANQIGKNDIQILHSEIGENSPYEANRLLSCLSVVFNKAGEWGLDVANPCLSVKKYREKSRDRFIQPDEFPRFLHALEHDCSQEVKDYIMLSLFTGARKSNVLAMKFEEIDWSSNKWYVPTTKNGESQIIHLVQGAMDILISKERREGFVFPSSTSKSGHLEDPKKSWNKILQKAGIKNLRLHDLRRTFGSYQAMTGATTAVIGKSLNHKTQQATAVYARMNLDVVAQSVEKAVGEMFKSKVVKEVV